MGLRDYTIYDFLQHNARVAGSEPVAIDTSGLVSNLELLERVDQLAGGIAGQGINKGERICILAQNSIDYLVLLGACAKTGAIAYPINWRLSAAEVSQVIQLADPKMLVIGADHIPQLAESDLSNIPVRALIDEGSLEGFIPLQSLYQSPSNFQVDIQSDDPFVVISTAAVAGVPRGAVLTHENMVLAGYQLITALGLSAADHHLAALPLFHITGLGLALAMIQVRGVNIIQEKFEPTQAVHLMDKHAVTLVADFPPILTMLLDARKLAGAHWDNLKYVIGLDSPDVIQRLYTETGAKFWTGFGQSETSGLVSLVRVDAKPGSAGRALPLIKLRCVDESGEDVPIGEVGEIAVQGPMVFTGYWRDPDATAYTFRNGWHHTGDLGRLDAEGHLYYAGRKPEKDLIKSGGENVYPAEVEQVLQELPEVVAVCVIGVPDPEWGEAVKAVIELEPGKVINLEQVSAAVAAQIASYKKPRFVDFVEEMPRTASGEIDRVKVKAVFGGKEE